MRFFNTDGPFVSEDILDLLESFLDEEDVFPVTMPRTVVATAINEIKDLRKQVEFYKDYLLDREHMRFF
jgi:hypothetical protein